MFKPRSEHVDMFKYFEANGEKEISIVWITEDYRVGFSLQSSLLALDGKAELARGLLSRSDHPLTSSIRDIAVEYTENDKGNPLKFQLHIKLNLNDWIETIKALEPKPELKEDKWNWAVQESKKFYPLIEQAYEKVKEQLA